MQTLKHKKSWKIVVQNSLRLAVVLPFLLVSYFLPSWHGQNFGSPAEASGTTYTVCPVGCNFRNLESALNTVPNSLVPGDTLLVSSTYVSNADFVTNTIAIVPTSSITIDCANNPVTIGYASSSWYKIITSFNTTTIQNCSFQNVNIQVRNDADNFGFSFLNNTMGTSTTSSVEVGAGSPNSTSTMSSFTISGNRLNQIIVYGTSTNGMISNNVLTGYDTQNGPLQVANGSAITITSNTLDNMVVRPTSSPRYLLDVSGTNITISSNTFSFSVAPGYILGPIGLSTFGYPGVGEYTILGNNIDLPSNIDGVYGVGVVGTSSTQRLLFSHNTVMIPSSCTSCGGLNVVDGYEIPIANVGVTSTYNIFYSPTTTPYWSRSQIIYKTNASSTVYFYDDYNGFFNVTYNIYNSSTSTNFALGTHSLPGINPFFQTGDADGSNDRHLAPFSNYLDVNGEEDIGPYSGVRRNSIFVDTAGIINYGGAPTVDATSTFGIGDALRSGDTLTIASGNYVGFSVSSSLATNAVTIVGSGASTIINASTTPAFRSIQNFTLNGMTFNLSGTTTAGLIFNNLTSSTLNDLSFNIFSNSGAGVIVSSSTVVTFSSSTFSASDPNAFSSFPLLLSQVTTSTFSHLVTQGAVSSTVQYLITNNIFDFNGNTYNRMDLVSGGSWPIDSSLFLNTGCSDLNELITADDTNVADQVGNGTQNINLVLFNVSGGRITTWVRNDIAGSASAVAALCSLPAPDVFVTSALQAVGDGSYTYNAAAVAAAGVTASAGFGNPPTLIRNDSGTAGIKILNSSNNLFSSITSTNNSTGLFFSGTSANNTVSSSVLTGNTLYGIVADAAGDTLLKKVTFATGSVSGVGNVYVYATARAFVENNSLVPMGGVSVSVASANGLVTSTLVSDAAGYTAFTDYLLAFIMTSSSVTTTNGGYNPYVFTAAASSTFTNTSTSSNLTSPSTTVTLVLTPPAPTPSRVGSSPPLVGGGSVSSPTPPSAPTSSPLPVMVPTTTPLVSATTTSSTVTVSTSSPAVVPELNTQTSQAATNVGNVNNGGTQATPGTPSTVESPYIKIKTQTAPKAFYPGATVRYQYSDTNPTKKPQTILIYREILDAANKVIFRSTGVFYLKPKATFTKNVVQTLNKKWQPGRYTIRIRVFNALTKELHGFNSEEIELRPKK